MIQLLDLGSEFKLILNKNVNFVEEIDRLSKGYFAIIGETKIDKQLVVSKITYFKKYINDEGNEISVSKEDILKRVSDYEQYKAGET